MSDTGILTSTQRERLEGEPEKSQSERDMRGRIRDQVYNALELDGRVLLEELRDTDRKQIFKSIESVQKAAELTDEERKEEVIEAAELQPGISHLLAFLYIGLEEQPLIGEGSFGSTLEDAMRRVADQNGWALEEFEFNIEFDKDAYKGDLKAKFESGEATIPEATKLLQREEITHNEFTEYAEEYLG